MSLLTIGNSKSRRGGRSDEQRSLSGALDRARRQKENTIRILFEWSDKQYKV